MFQERNFFSGLWERLALCDAQRLLDDFMKEEEQRLLMSSLVRVRRWVDDEEMLLAGRPNDCSLTFRATRG